MKFLLKQILSVSFLAVLFSSCKKDLLDINVDPNNPTTVSASAGLVLPAALSATASIYNNPVIGNNGFVFAGLWLGHVSYSGNYAIQTENVSYNITNNFGSGIFTELYDNINDYDFVEKNGAATSNLFYQGIGILMKAYNFQTLVDLYNNVPYSQALQGTANTKPAYDNGKDIYDSLAIKMDTAISYFTTVSSSGTISITGDIMFGGDASQWLQFANTVKLRLLLRQTEIADRQSYIQTEAAKLDSVSFLASDATINPGYSASDGKANPFYESNVKVTIPDPVAGYNQTLYRPGQYAINFFKTHNDPRLGSFYQPVGGSGNTYVGNFFGDQGIPNNGTSQFGYGVLKSPNQNSVLMLAAESYFLQSEAVLRGLITGDAKALYQSGVEASFEYLGLAQDDAITYYSQPGDKQVNWDATTTFQEKLALIIRQKWAALTLINELEPYNDYRRLHLPADVPLSTSPFSTGIFPNRLRYPQREFEVNAANVSAQGNPTAGDKVWWIP